MKLVIVLFLSLAACAQQQCRWGLAPNTQCASLEKTAAERIHAAKTACMSTASAVSWAKNLENPETAHTLKLMRRAYAEARNDYLTLTSCKNARLIFKFEVEKTDHAALDVFDSESGDTVFHERRDLKDEEADLHRLALHFLQAHQEANTLMEIYQVAHDAGCKDEKIAAVVARYPDWSRVLTTLRNATNRGDTCREAVPIPEDTPRK